MDVGTNRKLGNGIARWIVVRWHEGGISVQVMILVRNVRDIFVGINELEVWRDVIRCIGKCICEENEENVNFLGWSGQKFGLEKYRRWYNF